MLLNKLMIIIKNYFLERSKNSKFFYVRSREVSHCPYCEGDFKVIGSRKRILCKQDGTTAYLMIRRLRCLSCLKISHELPDLIIPYKRYEIEVIAASLLESECGERDCYPCETSTVLRWKLWFFLLHEYFENSVCDLMRKWNCNAFILLPLYPLERQKRGWLNVLVWGLVNSNRWRQTRSA